MNTIAGLFHLRHAPEDSCVPPIGNPTRDWMLIFVGVAIVFVLLAALAGWIYLGAAAIGMNATQNAEAQNNLGPTKTQLDSLLSNYQTRAQQNQQLLSSPQNVSDPAH